MQITLYDSFTANNLSGFLLLTVIIGGFTLALASLSAKRFQVTHSKDTAQTFQNPVPVAATALILGMGLGGFFDGIVFHQILQWHSMLSNRIPQLNPESVHINMFWDGLFHIVMLLVVATGIISMLKLLSRTDINFSHRLFTGGLLAGWGIFNLIEGAINHHIFKLHNVREYTEDTFLYNIVFMVMSLLLLFIGGYLLKTTLAKTVVCSGSNKNVFL